MRKKGKRKNDLVIYEEIFVTFGRKMTSLRVPLEYRAKSTER